MENEEKTKEELFSELKFLREKKDEFEEIRRRCEKERVEIAKVNRALRTLSDCNQILVRAREEKKFLQDICNILIATGGYKLAWVGYAEDDSQRSVIPAAYAGFEEGYLEVAKITWDDNPNGWGPVGTSIRNKEIQIIPDVNEADTFRLWRDSAVKRGYNSIISLPLIHNRKCYGSLAIYSSELNYFDKNEVELLDELAQDMSYGITVLRNEIRREKFEHDLQVSEENYRKLVEISPNPIGVHINGKFVFVNNAAVKLIGAEKPEDLLGKPVINILHPDYHDMVFQRISQMQTGQDVPTMEEKFVRLDGKVIDVMVAGSRMIYKGQNAIQIVVNDITDLKKIETDLRANEERFRNIFENAPIGMYKTAPDGKILMANRVFYQMLGYNSFEEFSKLNMNDIYLDKEVREKLIQIVKTKGQKIGFETLFKRKDGSEINVRFNTRYVKNTDDNNYFLEGTVEDITTQMKIKEELVKAKERAEEISSIKSNFLANMSHELRTPLVAILGFADIFRSELEDETHQEMADSIYISGQRLLETLNSILELSRIEANKVDMKNEELNLSNIVREITESLQKFAQKKGLEINSVIKDETAVGIFDKQMIYKIFNHLINNSIKYTVKGSITLELDTYLQDDKKWISISVKDTGIGIPSKSLNIIFEEFRQASEGLNRNFEGPGLGLTITKKFVEILKGKISVSSKEGEGTEFVVNLPATKISRTDSSVESKNNLLGSLNSKSEEKRPSILLVENDQPTIDVTRIILRKFYNIDVESTGIDAITAAGKNKYDLILMDINLGAGMDGTEAMKKIKELPGNSDTPVIAFTAYAMTGDKEKFLREGFSDYIAKPFEKKTLLDLLSKIFAQRGFHQ